MTIFDEALVSGGERKKAITKFVLLTGFLSKFLHHHIFFRTTKECLLVGPIIDNIDGEFYVINNKRGDQNSDKSQEF